MEALDVRAAFNAIISTPTMNAAEIERVLDGVAVMETLSPVTSAETGARLVDTPMRPFLFRGAEEKRLALELLGNMDIGVKKLLMVLEMAKQEEADGTQFIELAKLKEVLRNVN